MCKSLLISGSLWRDTCRSDLSLRRKSRSLSLRVRAAVCSTLPLRWNGKIIFLPLLLTFLLKGIWPPVHLSGRVDLQTDRGLHHHQLLLGGAPGPGHHHDGSHQARLQEAEGHQQGVWAEAGRSEGLDSRGINRNVHWVSVPSLG